LIPQGTRRWRIAFGGLLMAAAADAFAPVGGLSLLPRSNARASHTTSARKAVCMAGGAALPGGGAAPFGTQADLQDTVDRAAQGQTWKKKVTLLGSTGSIGTQTLDIVDYLPDRFEIEGLAAGGNVKLLAEQIKKFNPKIVSVGSDKALGDLKALLADWKGKMPEFCVGDKGLVEVARYGESDVVVTGVVGCAGLLPTVEAIKAGKDIALANKETLISGGPAILPLLKKHGVKMTPADSEHSAIFQSLQVGVYHSVLLALLVQEYKY